MLIGDMRGPNGNMVKNICEIFLDRDNKKDITNILSSTRFTKDGFAELQNFLLEHDLKDDYIKSLLSEIKKYLISSSDFFSDYIRMNRLRPILMSKITHNTLFDHSRVIEYFIEVFNSKYVMGYDINSGTLASYIVNCFASYFINDCSKEIYEIINDRSSMVGEGESSLDLLDTTSVDFSTYDNSFDFKRDVENVYNASLSLFEDIEFVAYYDLLTCYIKDSNKSKIENLKVSIYSAMTPGSVSYKTKSFLQSNGFFVPITISTDEDVMTEYRLGTKKQRLKYVALLFEYLGEMLNYKNIKTLYHRLITEDISAYTSKNKSDFFYFPRELSLADPSNIEKIKDIRHNEDKFIVLLKGLNSLRNLVAYCNTKNIDIKSIPVEIFRTNKYFSRYKNLEDCLSCFSYTKTLIQESENSQKIFSLYTNDEVTETLLRMGDFNFSILNKEISKLENIDYTPYDISMVYKNWSGKAMSFAKLSMALIDHISATYNSVYDVGDAWFNDELLKQVIASLVDPNIARDINFMLGDPRDKLPISYCRYINIRTAILVKILQGSRELSVKEPSIFKLGEGSLRYIPSSVSTLEDLYSIDKRLDLYLDKGMDLACMKELSYLYSLVYDELKTEIELINTTLESILEKYKLIGINLLENNRTLPLIVSRASRALYDTRTRIQDFVPRIYDVEYIDGILYTGGKPYMFCDMYVHEYGYLLDSRGNVVRRVYMEDGI